MRYFELLDLRWVRKLGRAIFSAAVSNHDHQKSRYTDAGSHLFSSKQDADLSSPSSDRHGSNELENIVTHSHSSLGLLGAAHSKSRIAPAAPIHLQYCLRFCQRKMSAAMNLGISPSTSFPAPPDSITGASCLTLAPSAALAGGGAAPDAWGGE